MVKVRRVTRPLLTTGVVIVVLIVGGGAVFLRGSAQRREDRAAVAAYERAILPALREGGRVVEQEMKPSLRELADGEITGPMLIQRVPGWRTTFEKARADLVAVDAPEWMGDVERRWGEAMSGYLAVVAALEGAARVSGAERERLLDEAVSEGKRADELFDDAASVIQFHRRRLGLPVSRNLPDPDAEPT